MLTVYEQPHVFCGQCRATKRMLTKEGIPFEVAELTNEKIQEVKALGHTQAPIVETHDGEIWSGHRPDRIEMLKASQVA